MIKANEYIETLEKLLLSYAKRNKHNIKSTNEKIKNICILLAQKGFTPNEINKCFDLKTSLYNKEGDSYSDDDDIDIEEEQYYNDADIINQYKLLFDEQMVLNDNPVIMLKNLKKFFNDKTSTLKAIGLIEKNKWSNEDQSHHHKRQKTTDK